MRKRGPRKTVRWHHRGLREGAAASPRFLFRASSSMHIINRGQAWRGRAGEMRGIWKTLTHQPKLSVVVAEELLVVEQLNVEVASERLQAETDRRRVRPLVGCPARGGGTLRDFLSVTRLVHEPSENAEVSAPLAAGRKKKAFIACVGSHVLEQVGTEESTRCARAVEEPGGPHFIRTCGCPLARRLRTR